MKTITVRGVGKASAPVDTVELSFRLWAKDMCYEKALHAANLKVAALESALCDAGFPAADFQTAGFRVNPEYESVCDEKGNYQTVFAGYHCSYDQQLRFDFDSARLGDALAAVSASNAEPELQVSFTVRQPEKLEAELLRSAAERAKARAEMLCAAAGRQLGKLQRIDYDVNRLIFQSETSLDMSCMPQAGGNGMAKRSISASLRPQDIELQETAVFVWEIL